MRLAPISIPYRAVQKASSLVITAVLILSVGSAGIGGVLGFVGLAVGIVAVALAYELAYYRRFEYELTDDTFDLRSGVVSRREREIPYRRIQNVDVTQNVLQRVAGIAAVNLETAGGDVTEAVIRYVTVDEAERLQRDIRRRKRGDEPAPADGEEETVEELFTISPSELTLVGVLSFDPRVPGAIFALLSGSIPLVSRLLPGDISGMVFALGLAVVFTGIMLLSWLAGVVSAVVNYYGFRLARTDDELRYERGLLQRYSGTIPFDKIQTVTIEENPLKRRFGFATLAIETAGYAPGQAGGRGSEAAVPLASVDRVRSLANELEPFGDPDFERPPKRIRRRYAFRYLLALGAITAALYGVVALFGNGFPWYAPAAAVLAVPFAAHYKWKHRGYWLGANHVVTRNGFWVRRTKVVPYYRIQTVIDTRTVFQRRWDVATIIVDTAGSLSVLGDDAAAVDIDDEDANALRGELNDRLRAAMADRRRRQRTAFQWFVDEDPTEIGNGFDDEDADENGADAAGPSRTADFRRESDARSAERSPDETDR
ncbi:PH domain-containing protein [Haloferacaceae archaeon DSL9]